ncbi:SDR family NAD(P)-dependent oxidoreductase [Hephaestia sp. GCM10023244]|uniref:SDR family NAD(P)-dependent oxidoreductase n=1 Tax=unclassified Hephaestia TaxID=2631281 RepID=UPI00207729AE|nr:glucose 1-dehydrogenase [Hephaestia sp. MAHUQ-44]MCM8732342.1 glucose 1-dehydrogenase [Hephaestia sp. MAHUQ-44]
MSVQLNQNFQGRTVIVTGGGNGIGGAIASEFGARGANVVVNDIDAARAVRKAAEIGNGAIATPGDASSSADVAAVVGKALAAFGKVDILINNAGMDQAVSILDLEEEDWDRLIAVNLKSAFLFSKAVLPGMIAQSYGRIVCVSSVVAHRGAMNGGIHYGTTKGGMLGFARTLARQMAKTGVTVNAIAPGVVETDLIRTHLPPDVRAAVVQEIPLGRLAEPSEIGRAVAFLASEDAGYLTGATLDVNGGFWIG